MTTYARGKARGKVKVKVKNTDKMIKNEHMLTTFD